MQVISLLILCKLWDKQRETRVIIFSALIGCGIQVVLKHSIMIFFSKVGWSEVNLFLLVPGITY